MERLVDVCVDVDQRNATARNDPNRRVERTDEFAPSDGNGCLRRRSHTIGTL